MSSATFAVTRRLDDVLIPLSSLLEGFWRRNLGRQSTMLVPFVAARPLSVRTTIRDEDAYRQTLIIKVRALPQPLEVLRGVDVSPLQEGT